MKRYEQSGEEDHGSCRDGVHDRDGDAFSEKVKIEIHAVLHAFQRFVREAEIFHFPENSAHHVVFDERRSVGAGEEGKDSLKPGGKAGNGHVRAADEAVACTDDGAYGGSLPGGG